MPVAAMRAHLLLCEQVAAVFACQRTHPNLVLTASPRKSARDRSPFDEDDWRHTREAHAVSACQKLAPEMA